ncbi:unnamed protein product [Scytosiphon promiscuus]
MGAVAYLVLSNPSTKNNLGTLIRCAAAFAVEEVVVVGATRWSTHGAHGSNKHVRYRCFDDWESAAAFLKNEKDCDLCGIVGQTASRKTLPPGSPDAPQRRSGPASPAAATDVAVGKDPSGMDGMSASGLGTSPSRHSAGNARSSFGDNFSSSKTSELRSSPQMSLSEGEGGGVEDRSLTSTAVRRRPFRRSTAFLVGHRNRLGTEALDVCDFLVHVEQQAGEFPMDLGAPVTTSIALHHFTAWAKYEERQFTGEKFNVDRDVARRRPLLRKVRKRISEGPGNV